MSNSYFQFKQFKINQDRCAMKVGTDGVLLGAWADVASARSILDIGTGTGLLSLMVAQRSKAEITAIEIDQDASLQAEENVDGSPWKERIKVINCSLQEFQGETSFDHIISNPPYFNQSLKSERENRSLARHTDTLSYEELLYGAAQLLNKEGKFSVILPYNEKENFFRIAESHQLYPKRIVTIYPTPSSTPKRFMAELIFNQEECINSNLIIEATGRHQYSEEYKRLTEEYYLGVRSK